MAKTTDGFVMIPNWLIDDVDLTLHELAVYMVLLRFRNPTSGQCWPGFTTIADRARVSRKSVQRTIPRLEAKGLIRVERRKDMTVNQTNVYHVAIPTEPPRDLLSVSTRGRRIPKRPTPRDSESMGRAVTFAPTDSESTPKDSQSLPPDSQSPPPGTPSPSKKTKGTRSTNETQEEDLTPVPAEPVRESFTFIDEMDKPTASHKQIAYLCDLFIHLQHQEPNDLVIARWRKLTPSEATNQIRGYLKAIGRPDEIYYPEPGSPEYNALSAAGKEFADTAGMPDSVYPFSAGNRTA